MSNDKDESMKNLVLNWGIPEVLLNSENNIIFKFDNEGISNSKETYYHCKYGDVKFCLYDEVLKKVLFSMDFHKTGARLSNLLKIKRIRLELLYVHEESLRKKGIASYYIEKLIEYAINEGFEHISVTPNAMADNFIDDSKINALTQLELEKFYKKRSTPLMPIVFN